MTTILGLSGSLRFQSESARALAIALAGAREQGAHILQYDLRTHPLPLYDGAPNQAVESFRAQMRAAHGVILATPEYHGGYSGVLKNALDWTGKEYFQDKPVGLIGVSAGSQGALGALGSLREIGRNLHAWVVPQQAAVSGSHRAFGENGEAHDRALEERLRAVGIQVARFAMRPENGAGAESRGAVAGIGQPARLKG